MLRRLTRGLGERTQPKEIRNSDYPQNGLVYAVVPDAVNTTVTGCDVVAIRGDSKYDPILINSWFSFFNSKVNTFALPYLNLKKGECGYGLTYTNYPGSITSFNISSATQLYHKRDFVFNHNQSSINSFGTPSQHPLAINTPRVFSSRDTNLINISTSTSSGVHPQRYYGKLLILQNYFEMIKGGVSIPVTQIRNGLLFDITRFKGGVATGFQEQRYPIERLNSSIAYRVSGVEPYGSLSYSNTNTNQNNNCAWILSQRTQYQRKFNPLKTLGV